jgi:serine/threonine protein kinase/tetratricopeptide (TPR) repeat protein
VKSRTLKHYKLLRRLGSGSSGTAYLADDTKLLRPVVLKLLHNRPSTDKSRTDILREARLASAIDHQNVCSIFEVDEVDGRAFIVMQFVPGRSLDQLIGGGPLGLELALSISIQICDGLAEAHRLGIVHGDLKPANIMITEGGLVKILDFGVAKKITTPKDAAVSRGGRSRKNLTAPGGTVAYMAPEQFVTGKSSDQSDIFALGIILYQMVTGRHPFLNPVGVVEEIARSIQYLDPQPPSLLRSDLPLEFEGLILKALAKEPANRFDSAVALREALKTLMKSLHFEAGFIPGEASAALPIPENGGDKRTGFFSMLAERLIGREAAEVPKNSIVAIPFANLGTDEAPFYGMALADSIATRLSRLPSITVRPFNSVVLASHVPPDPIKTGEKLRVSHVLTGSFLRSDRGFDLNWHLLEVASGTVQTGGTISVPSLDLIAIQNAISDEVYASLRGISHIQPGIPAAQPLATINGDVAEDYLQGRALLSSFIWRSRQRDDLDKALGKLRSVLARAPEFAPAHSGLGIIHLQYAQNALGGVANLVEAQRAFERALNLDTESVEAHLYRVYTFLARGEKESARRGVHHLLETAGHEPAVHMVAGVVLRLDGLYKSAIDEFTTTLRLNPDTATLVYNNRARIYHYQGQLELAMQEVNKGLSLEPKHPLLRTSLGYLYFRQSMLDQAIRTLESLLEENAEIRIAYPTLAMCYLVAGQQARAESLIKEEILTAAEADGEMAYRLATYFALDNNPMEALHWLRRAIYLGDENYPWFSRNPAWKKLRNNSDFITILTGLKQSHRQNRQRWKRLLSSLATTENLEKVVVKSA